MRPLSLLLLAPALAAACAHKAGQEAAAGAVAGLREEEVTRLAGKAGHRLATGIIDELAKKEEQQRIREITGAAVSGAFEGATGVPPGPWAGPGGVGGAGAAPTCGDGLGGSGAVARSPAGLLAKEMGTGLKGLRAQSTRPDFPSGLASLERKPPMASRKRRGGLGVRFGRDDLRVPSQARASPADGSAAADSAVRARRS